MADFLDKLHEAVAARRGELARHVCPEAAPDEVGFERLVRANWLPLPAAGGARLPAYAVDGSVGESSLDNGSTVIIVQTLCLGDDGHSAADVAIDILPATTPRPTASRVADLLQQHKELGLACATVNRAAPGSVVFLDGSLYSRLPQLYPLAGEGPGGLEALPASVLDNHLALLEAARRRGVALVAVSKTSREATHCKVWRRHAGLDLPLPPEVTDSQAVHRWTDGAAGVSTPVVLGTWGFTGGSRDLLDLSDLAGSPAIASFFVRLADYDDALRVDVPAHQVGWDGRLGDLDGGVLPGGAEAVAPVVGALLADYGGPEVYNALLFAVDREVRLHRGTVAQLYLPLIETQLGYPLRLDRSARRFARPARAGGRSA